MSKQVFEDYSVSINIRRMPTLKGGSEVIMTVTADEDTLAGIGGLVRNLGDGWGSLAQGVVALASTQQFMSIIANAVAPKPSDFPAEAFDPSHPPRSGRRHVNRRDMKAQGRQTGPVPPAPAPPAAARRPPPPAAAAPQRPTGPVITPPPAGFHPMPKGKVKPLKKK